jgi:uncharacterized protein YbaR (Trm112 family)
MPHEFAQDIIPRTNAPIVERVATQLRCPECGTSPLRFYGDDSLERNVLDHGVLVCETCKACYPFEHDTLFLMPERPERSTRALSTGFVGRAASTFRSPLRSLTACLFSEAQPFNDKMSFLSAGLDVRASNEPLIVDFGASDGSHPLRIARQLKETGSAGFVMAIHSSPTMLAAGARTARSMDLQDRVLWVLADARSVPLVDGAADRVTCVAGLNEYSEIQTVLFEIRRILSVKGSFHAAVLQRGTGPVGVLQTVLHRGSGLFVRGTAEWRALLSAHFEIEHEEEHGPWLFARMK